MALAITVLIVFLLLLINEVWWRRSRAQTEVNRKFVHITVGTFVAFWPFFLSWQDIRILSIAFVLVVALSKYLHVFRAIHSVQRPTWGEVCFGLAVGLITLVTDNKWIYMTALLQMSLADGLAAIVGTRYGAAHRYRIAGQSKSLAGTLTFVIVSLLSFIAFMYLNGTYIQPIAIVAMALGGALIENLGIYGIDNLLVPLFVAVALGLII